jgi:hypothetical protein
MAFCGQCGLLLTNNTTKCPRCGTVTDFNASVPEAPEDENSPTLMTHTNNPNRGSAPYTPSSLPSDTIKAPYYAAPEGNAYQEQRAPQNGTYPTPGGFSHSGSNYIAPDVSAPNSLPQSYNQVPAMYSPEVFPSTNPNYPFQVSPPPRKTRRWPFILIAVLIVALVAVTVMFFALDGNSFAGIFGANHTPTPQVTPTAPPATTTQQNTPTPTQPSPTAAAAPTQQAQATIQQYYTDINNHDYQDAYNLWVNNPDNYTHYMQGFAHTHQDAITFGDAIPQVDGTVQVNVTIQATEDAAGGGTKVTTYQGYYIVGQQTDGSWKIITAQIS